MIKRFLLVQIAGVLLAVAQFTSAAAVNYELYVGSYSNDKLLRYDTVTNSVTTLSNGGGGLDNPEGVAVGPDNLVYVTSAGTDKILRYDPTTSAYADTFANTNLSTPQGVDFDSSGKVYAVNGNVAVHNVNRFNASGTFDATFVTPASDGGGYYRAEWSPDGLDYYVVGYTTGVRKFNSSGTETFSTGVQPFIPTALLGTFTDVDFGPDGNLYVTGYSSGTVYRFNPSTGALLATVITGLANPYGMVFTPDNKLYISSYSGSTVRRYNYSAGTSWSLDATVMTSADGISGPSGMDFRIIPEPSSLTLCGIAILLMCGVSRRRW